MDTDPSSRKQQINIGYVLFAIVGMLLLQWALARHAQVEAIPFSQFEQLVAQSEVAEVAVGGERPPAGRLISVGCLERDGVILIAARASLRPTDSRFRH